MNYNREEPQPLDPARPQRLACREGERLLTVLHSRFAKQRQL